MSNYAVTLNYKCNYGYVEYNEATKTASVKLAVAEAKAAVEKFLAAPLTLDVPQGETIRDFVTKTLGQYRRACGMEHSCGHGG